MVERPILFSAPMVRAILSGAKTQTRRPVKGGPDWAWPAEPMRSPMGAVGDRLWARESFRLLAGWDGVPHTMACSNPLVWYEADPTMHWRALYGKLRPSIHMPRWASRITLEVVGVRLERLHEITEADAKAEGLKAITKDGTLVKYGIPDSDGLPGTDDTGWPWHAWERDPREAFRKVWDATYGTWDANPIVWVCEFRRVEVPRG